MPQFLGKKSLFALFSVVLILLSALIFQNKNNQGLNWTFPYFSGAANFERLFEWRISPSEYEAATKLSDQEYRKYKHNKTEDTIVSINNFYGYVLIARASKTLFPWLGDLNGVILFQVSIHIITSVFILIKVFETSLQRYGFLFLYAANPIIIYFVTLPIYFFWTSMPSMVFIIVWLKPRWRPISIPISVPVLLFSLLIRPTTLFLCMLVYITALAFTAIKKERLIILFCLILFAGGGVVIQGQSIRSPWHTMYVGLGAYSNDYGINNLSDNQGYQLYERRTGLIIDTNAISGNYNNPEVRRQYDEILKKQYFQIATEHPISVLRNAAINTFLAFSIGYIVDHAWVTWGMTFFGLMIILLFAATRQWVWFLSILSASAGYIWYYPPIPAYHFGAYPLLVTGVIFAVQVVINSKFNAGNSSEPLSY